MSHPTDAPLTALLQRAERLLTRLETLLPAAPEAVDWSAANAFRWQAGGLHPVRPIQKLRMKDLIGVDEQKRSLRRNTRQFLAGGASRANNVLLTGARGTGKSSLIKALLDEFAADGLRLIEVDRQDLHQLMRIVERVAERPERFIIYCDDLSFEADDAGYKSLKSALEGSLAATPDNLLIYATSNRRHLMPDFMADNLTHQRSESGEIHPGESVEERVSLSERFGLWLSFYPIDQEQYLAICAHWLKTFGLDEQAIAAAQSAALNWALLRGGRSGRIAWQFARDRAGRR